MEIEASNYIKDVAKDVVGINNMRRDDLIAGALQVVFPITTRFARSPEAPCDHPTLWTRSEWTKVAVSMIIDTGINVGALVLALRGEPEKGAALKLVHNIGGRVSQDIFDATKSSGRNLLRTS